MYNSYNLYPYHSFGAPMNGMRMNGFAGNGGILGRFLGSNRGMAGIPSKFNWGNILSNTQKTLGVINQAIPIFYQVRPIWNNAKTMFKIMGALKDDTDSQNERTTEKKDESSQRKTTTREKSNNAYTNQPNFFL